MRRKVRKQGRRALPPIRKLKAQTRDMESENGNADSQEIDPDTGPEEEPVRTNSQIKTPTDQLGFLLVNFGQYIPQIYKFYRII